MPIYEYKCSQCGKEFEVFQSITDSEVTSCKFCNGPVGKIMSLSSFHLSGSGWYVTDYGGRKAPVGERQKEETSSSPASEKTESSSVKTDTKKEDA